MIFLQQIFILVTLLISIISYIVIKIYPLYKIKNKFSLERIQKTYGYFVYHKKMLFLILWLCIPLIFWVSLSFPKSQKFFVTLEYKNNKAEEIEIPKNQNTVLNVFPYVNMNICGVLDKPWILVIKKESYSQKISNQKCISLSLSDYLKKASLVLNKNNIDFLEFHIIQDKNIYSFETHWKKYEKDLELSLLNTTQENWIFNLDNLEGLKNLQLQFKDEKNQTLSFHIGQDSMQPLSEDRFSLTSTILEEDYRDDTSLTLNVSFWDVISLYGSHYKAFVAGVTYQDEIMISNEVLLENPLQPSEYDTLLSKLKNLNSKSTEVEKDKVKKEIQDFKSKMQNLSEKDSQEEKLLKQDKTEELIEKNDFKEALKEFEKNVGTANSLILEKDLINHEKLIDILKNILKKGELGKEYLKDLNDLKKKTKSEKFGSLLEELTKALQKTKNPNDLKKMIEDFIERSEKSQQQTQKTKDQNKAHTEKFMQYRENLLKKMILEKIQKLKDKGVSPRHPSIQYMESLIP